MSAEIHLIHGFMGFGKTTLAKQLEKSLPAVHFTHDEIMLTRYGRTPDNFAKSRVLTRTQNNPDELYIDESCFDDRLKKFTFLNNDEGYNIVYHYTN